MFILHMEKSRRQRENRERNTGFVGHGEEFWRWSDVGF
jgi:hypothetical protein